MLRCIGSKRISIVVQDKKQKYLIVKAEKSEGLEFPGFSVSGNEMPADDIEYVKKEIEKIIGISITSVKLIEIYFDDSIPWRHYIYRAEIEEGIPTKVVYEKIYWKSFDEIKDCLFNKYGLEVKQKIAECTYCKKLYEKKSDLDIFFHEYLSHDAGMLVSNVINQAGDFEDVYKMAIRYYFSHLRAWLVESPNLKNNRTIQNYLVLYGRQDLLAEVNQVLELNVTDVCTLRYLIKSYVDTNIAHYDKSSEETKQVVEFCNSVFGKDGCFPLDEFVGIMESYMMSLLIEMWFYAGELGADIGNPDPTLAVLMDVNRQGLLDTMEERFNAKEQR